MEIVRIGDRPIITVKSQEDLNTIDNDFDGFIIIDLGMYAENVPIFITKEYRHAIIKVFNNTLIEVNASNNTIEAFDNCKVMAYRSNVIYAYGDSTVIARGDNYVIARGNSTIMLCGNSHADAYCHSHIKAYNKSSVEAYSESETYLYDDSFVNSYKGTTIHVCGNNVVFRSNLTEGK